MKRPGNENVGGRQSRYFTSFFTLLFTLSFTAVVPITSARAQDFVVSPAAMRLEELLAVVDGGMLLTCVSVTGKILRVLAPSAG